MWQSATIFINVLGMVHSTKLFVHSPREIPYLTLLISQSKFVSPLEFEITRGACNHKILKQLRAKILEIAIFAIIIYIPQYDKHVNREFSFMNVGDFIAAHV